MKKWTKVALITTPLLFVGSVYAFANERSESQAAIQIREVNPAEPVTDGGKASEELPVIANPFVVNKEQIMQQLSAQSAGSQQTSADQGNANQPLTIDTIKKLQIKAKTDRGELKLEYNVEGNGTPVLNGEIGGLKIHVSGDKAKELMNQLLTRWKLLAALQQTIADPNAKLDGKTILSLADLELETIDGKKIELDQQKLKFEKKGPQPVNTGANMQLKVEDEGNKEHEDKDDKEHNDKDDKEHNDKDDKEHEDKGKHKGQEKHDKNEKKSGQNHEKHDAGEGKDD